MTILTNSNFVKLRPSHPFRIASALSRSIHHTHTHVREERCGAFCSRLTPSLQGVCCTLLVDGSRALFLCHVTV
jgi:hypothetical protein